MYWPQQLADFIYIQIQVNLWQEVCYTNTKWKAQVNSLCKQKATEAAKKYSITLELCGLALNIASFSHMLKRVDFDRIVNHLSLTYIIKSKAEPATTRIKRFLELITSYSFNLYYIKEKT